MFAIFMLILIFVDSDLVSFLCIKEIQFFVTVNISSFSFHEKRFGENAKICSTTFCRLLDGKTRNSQMGDCGHWEEGPLEFSFVENAGNGQTKKSLGQALFSRF